MPEPFFIKDMNKLIDHKYILIISFLWPCELCATERSWKDAMPVAAFFGCVVMSLAIAKKIAQQRSVTSAINNRIAFPLYQRFADDEDQQLPVDELREQNRQSVEKSLIALITRTQKRLAIIGAALTIAAGTHNKWWQTFANNIGWIQTRTEFGISMIYYFTGQEGDIHPFFSSPIRESLWISAALLYTQFYDLQRKNSRMNQHDFPEYVLTILSYLYELGRQDR